MKARLVLIQVLTLASFASAQLVPDGGTAIIDGVTNTLTGDLIVGTNAGNTTLILTNGGRVNSARGILGDNSGSSNNLVQVIGLGTVWSNSLNLIIGEGGARNILVVTNGGVVFSDGLTLGNASSSHSNRLQIVGPGSVCTASGPVRVGGSGWANELMIENGARLMSEREVEVGHTAQSTNNLLQVKGGSLITSNVLWMGGEETFGSRGNNRLIIESGGTVTNGLGCFGFQPFSTNNLALVTGPGSVWHNQNGLAVGWKGGRNSLVISNSALVRTDHGFLIGSNSFGNSIVVNGGLLSVGGVNPDAVTVGGYGSDNQLIVTNGGRVESSVNSNTSIGGTSGSNNLLVVSGPGSVWMFTDVITAGNINVGGGALVQNSRLIIENGGQAYVRQLRVSPSSGSNNAVIVTGPGSLLSANGLVNLGPSGAGAELSISNGGTVIAQGNLSVGVSTSSRLNISAATLIVTNAAGNNILDVLRGTNFFDGGTILTDLLRVINGAIGVFHFRRGELQSSDTVVNNGSPFVVGDGVNAAVFQLPGGTHTFNHGLVISSNAVLRGCGVINGPVVNRGTIIAECSGQPLTFSGAVTNYGPILTNSGGLLQFNGPVANTILGITKTGTVATVTYTSISGYSFALEYKDAVNQANWTPILPPLLGTGNPMTSDDVNATVTNRIYRVTGAP